MLECNATIEQRRRYANDLLLNSVVYPTELVFGFLLQLLNLWVLQGSKIRSCTYTVYLRGLSITYLISIVLTASTLLRKLDLVDARLYAPMLYYAHFEHYFQNALLFTGNLIVSALAAETVRGLLFPFSSLRQSSNRRGLIVLALCYMATLAILSPIPFSARLLTAADGLTYCIVINKQQRVRYTIAGIFELAILVFVGSLNALLLAMYWRIQRDARRLLLRPTTIVNCTAVRSSTKAILICVASVSAYSVSNLPSALKESLYLLRELTGSDKLHALLDGDFGTYFRNISNISLLFNYILSVLIQYFVSTQYRLRTRQCLNRLRQFYLSGSTDLDNGGGMMAGVGADAVALKSSRHSSLAKDTYLVVNVVERSSDSNSRRSAVLLL